MSLIIIHNNKIFYFLFWPPKPIAGPFKWNKLQSKYLPGLSHQWRQPLSPHPRLVFSTAWTCPVWFPQDLFLPRDSHQFLSLSLWPLVRAQPRWGSRGSTAMQWEGWGSLRAHRILPAARCYSMDFALGPFLPSPQRVSISCFHFGGG